MTTEFHFSPRPNRAHDIHWLPWSDEAFARALRESKPVLLSISAVWCHWCHVMDETSYSDPQVIESINERFVPVRIDNDERPDINARYNMGGWPTTAFLTPEGSTLTGATYLPPEQMLRALNEISRFYAQERGQIAERVKAEKPSRETPVTSRAEPTEESIADFIDQLARGYDSEYGGFGTAPKFPQPEMLELLLTRWRITGEARLLDMVTTTIHAMASGGMYDAVEGGFFRYSTTRDWSVPHFEKMAEDHAGLIRVLAQLQLWEPNSDTRATLLSALGYVRRTLRNGETGFYAGSQDADEEYFSLDATARERHGAPFIDRRAYSNWSAALAGASLLASVALDDDTLATEGLQTLDSLHERMRDDAGLLFHVFTLDGEPTVRGILGDQTAYLRALIDAHETTGEARFLDRAAVHADAILQHFGAPDGGVYDHASMEAQLGRLTLRDRPIGDNALFADSLLRLGTLTGNPEYRTRAEAILALYGATFASAGSFAAAYVRALQRALAPEVHVKLVGTPAQTALLRACARRLPTPFAAIRTLLAGESAEIDPPSRPAPAAYLCVGRACGAPVETTDALQASFNALAETSARARV